jgi:DNA replication protein DnaC
MQPSVMTDMLRGLKLHGMAQALGELSAQDSPAYQAASPILSGLLKAELAEREVRSLAYQMKAARFPAYRDLAGFDFSLSQASEATVRQLHRCEFIDQAQNVVLVGGPGTGKTHLATALGVQAINTIGNASGSFTPSIWSTPWRQKKQPVNRAPLPPASQTPTS